MDYAHPYTPVGMGVVGGEGGGGGGGGGEEWKCKRLRTSYRSARTACDCDASRRASVTRRGRWSGMGDRERAAAAAVGTSAGGGGCVSSVAAHDDF